MVTRLRSAIVCEGYHYNCLQKTVTVQFIMVNQMIVYMDSDWPLSQY